MTALQTPAPDAPAAEWGAFAESIPGWREPDADMSYELPRIEVGSPIGDLPRPRYVSDVDHWAWVGWFMHLLGPVHAVEPRLPDGRHVRADFLRAVIFGTPGEICRVCILVAAAFGRWPGGGE